MPQNLGKTGEDFVAKDYQSRGFKILERNFKALGYKQLGEIDIIVLKKKNVVFVEVKSRTNFSFMDPAEAVGFRKQARLLKAIKVYLNEHPEYTKMNAQVDVAIVSAALDGKITGVTILSDVIQDS